MPLLLTDFEYCESGQWETVLLAFTSLIQCELAGYKLR